MNVKRIGRRWINARLLITPLPLIVLLFTSGCMATANSPAPEKRLRPFPATEETMLTVQIDGVSIHDQPSLDATVISSLQIGDRLRLIRRTGQWLLILDRSGRRGYVRASTLFSPKCTTDRSEPVIVEEPVFHFSEDPPHGVVVIEAEYDDKGHTVDSRVLQNTLEDPAYERRALDDLRRLRFLPPTSNCEPRAFIYTFTRRF